MSIGVHRPRNIDVQEGGTSHVQCPVPGSVQGDGEDDTYGIVHPHHPPAVKVQRLVLKGERFKGRTRWDEVRWKIPFVDARTQDQAHVNLRAQQTTRFGLLTHVKFQSRQLFGQQGHVVLTRIGVEFEDDRLGLKRCGGGLTAHELLADGSWRQDAVVVRAARKVQRFGSLSHHQRSCDRLWNRQRRQQQGTHDEPTHRTLPRVCDVFLYIMTRHSPSRPEAGRNTSGIDIAHVMVFFLGNVRCKRCTPTTIVLARHAWLA